MKSATRRGALVVTQTRCRRDRRAMSRSYRTGAQPIFHADRFEWVGSSHRRPNATGRRLKRPTNKTHQEMTMKTILASLLALGLLAGTANARTVFDQIRDSAPRSSGVFGDLQNSAPRSSVFDDLRNTAPRIDLRSDPQFGAALGRRVRRSAAQRALIRRLCLSHARARAGVRAFSYRHHSRALSLNVLRWCGGQNDAPERSGAMERPHAMLRHHEPQDWPRRWQWPSASMAP